MKLPRNNEAIVPESKIIHYLLSEAHPVRRAKARFFKELGYSVENGVQLKEDPLGVAAGGMVVEIIETAFGVKFVVDGSLLTPGGISARVRTIWILEAEHGVPRFVTAYPHGV